jgi:hypothetical protein
VNLIHIIEIAVFFWIGSLVADGHRYRRLRREGRTLLQSGKPENSL